MDSGPEAPAARKVIADQHLKAAPQILNGDAADNATIELQSKGGIAPRVEVITYLEEWKGSIPDWLIPAAIGIGKQVIDIPRDLRDAARLGRVIAVLSGNLLPGGMVIRHAGKPGPAIDPGSPPLARHLNPIPGTLWDDRGHDQTWKYLRVTTAV